MGFNPSSPSLLLRFVEVAVSCVACPKRCECILHFRGTPDKGALAEMSEGFVLSIDQGTTGTTALVFDRDCRVRGRGYSEVTQHYPRPGWVERSEEGRVGKEGRSRW